MWIWEDFHCCHSGNHIGVLEGVDLALMQHFKKGSKLLVLCVEGFGLQ